MSKVIFKIYLFSLQSLYRNCYDVSVLRNNNEGESNGGYYFKDNRFNKEIQ